MALLVRTWNVFHGRTFPEGRRLELERMVRLVSEDRPSLVALQEVPVWALGRLEEWSGMRALGAVAMPALGGPLARSVTELAPRALRSALVGQANVTLLGAGVEPAGRAEVLRLNPRSLRGAHRVGLGLALDWARNRRVAHLVPLQVEGAELLAVNLHASKGARLARLELDRLAGLLPAGPTLVCGDLNVPNTTLPGFSPPTAGIDQILVRGLDLEVRPERWPDERRRHGETLLSDHAPVEAVVTVRSPA